MVYVDKYVFVKVPKWTGFHNFKTPVEVESSDKNEVYKWFLKNKTQNYRVLRSGNTRLKYSSVKNGWVTHLAGNEVFDVKQGWSFRRSGLTPQLVKLCAERGVSVVFSFRDLLVSNVKHLVLARMSQNLFLCRKFGASFIIGSGARSEKELVPVDNLISFGVLLGLTREEAKNLLKD